jgi:excisionase family DNA binding protein
MNRSKVPADKDVLNVEEAAGYLGFSPYTIREKARDGEIPGRKIGKEWRFSRRMLLKWLEAEGGRGAHAQSLLDTPPSP